MTAKLRIDIPSMNWAYTVLLNPFQNYTLGTAKTNEIPLPPGSASENHAVISFRGAWTVEDLGSGRGTLVNGGVVALGRLKHRDVIKFGECEVTFQNPSEEAGAAEQQHTHQMAELQRSALENAVKRAEAGNAEFAELEKALWAGPASAAKVSPKPSAAPPARPSASAASKSGSDAISDMIWVAQTLADIMSEVLKQLGGREEAYVLMLSRLLDAIHADNGFVTIPNQLNSGWHVRAWVGDSAAWTEYERDHPLPRTVADRAFRTMKVVSNAMEGAESEPIASFSLQKLNVSGYIAVPLGQSTNRRGVLYFDTRNKSKKFTPRDVKLLELAGNCILQIEELPK